MFNLLKIFLFLTVVSCSQAHVIEKNTYDNLGKMTLADVVTLVIQNKVAIKGHGEANKSLNSFFCSIGEQKSESVLIKAFNTVLNSKKSKVPKEVLAKTLNLIECDDEGSFCIGTKKSDVGDDSFYYLGGEFFLVPTPLVLDGPEPVNNFPFVVGREFLNLLQQRKDEFMSYFNWSEEYIQSIESRIKVKLNIEHLIKSKKNRTELESLIYFPFKFEHSYCNITDFDMGTTPRTVALHPFHKSLDLVSFNFSSNVSELTLERLYSLGLKFVCEEEVYFYTRSFIDHSWKGLTPEDSFDEETTIEEFFGEKAIKSSFIILD